MTYVAMPNPGLCRIDISMHAAYGIVAATCAKLCTAAGEELEQIQLLLGQVSVQTTERDLGTKQDLVHAPNNEIKVKVAI
jgi:hypothetical protein